MLVPMTLAASWTAWRDRREILFPLAAAGLAGRVPGVLLGAWIYAIVSFKVFAWLFAISVLVGVALSLLGPRIEPTRRSVAAGGFAAGLMGTLTSIGGPPIILVMQHGKSSQVRATLSAFFAIGTALSIGALALFGKFGEDELWLGLGLAPPMLIGVFLSRYLTGWMDRGMLRPILLCLVALAAPLLIARAVLTP